MIFILVYCITVYDQGYKEWLFIQKSLSETDKASLEKLEYLAEDLRKTESQRGTHYNCVPVAFNFWP